MPTPEDSNHGPLVALAADLLAVKTCKLLDSLAKTNCCHDRSIALETRSAFEAYAEMRGMALLQNARAFEDTAGTAETIPPQTQRSV